MDRLFSIVVRYGLEDREIGVRFSGEHVFLFSTVATSAFWPVDIEGSSSGCKVAGT
jgi:hypothetical protein